MPPDAANAPPMLPPNLTLQQLQQQVAGERRRRRRRQSGAAAAAAPVVAAAGGGCGRRGVAAELEVDLLILHVWVLEYFIAVLLERVYPPE